MEPPAYMWYNEGRNAERWYINAYDNKDVTFTALVDKMLGRSEFKGVSSVDAFCGLGDTKYGIDMKLTACAVN